MEIISTEEGYTLIIDLENDEILVYETNEKMKAYKIAENLNITENAVSVILRRCMKKIYKNIKNRDKYLSSIDIIRLMGEMFNIKSEGDYKALYKMMPVYVKEDIAKWSATKIKFA